MVKLFMLNAYFKHYKNIQFLCSRDSKLCHIKYQETITDIWGSLADWMRFLSHCFYNVCYATNKKYPVDLFKQNISQI